jgi:adenosylcobinamide-phosphate synthase
MNLQIFEFAAGYILDLLLGDPKRLPHPIRMIGKIISVLLNFYRKIINNEYLVGLLIFLSVNIIIMIIYQVILKLILFTGGEYFTTLFNAIIIFYLLSTKSLYNESMKVYYSLKNNDIIKARKNLSYIVGRETENLDKYEIIRGTTETVAENISDGIIAPMFYIVLFGPLGCLIYKTVNTLDSMIGYKNEEFYYIGYVSAKADDILNFIPARITAGIISLISIFYGRFFETVKIIIRDRKKHSSPNAAYPEAAVAGLLGVQLGGVNKYFGKEVSKPFIGDKTHNLEITDIYKTNIIMITVSIIGFGLCLFLM